MGCTLSAWLGMDVQPVHVPERDKRFPDPTWSKNPAFFAAQHGYLAASHLVSDLSATWSATPGPGLPPGWTRSRRHRQPARPEGLVRGGRLCRP